MWQCAGVVASLFDGGSMEAEELMKIMEERRSIRKYKSDPVPEELVEKIIRAGLLSPSSKNRQPWQFTVVSGSSKEEMLSEMEKGLKEEEKDPLLPESAPYIRGAWETLSIMKEAPVIILIRNKLGKVLEEKLSIDERESEICNALSIGSAVEHMVLMATALGLGSLWICDICFALKRLRDWQGGDGELYAALAIGYADESPRMRPRKSYEKAVTIRK